MTGLLLPRGSWRGIKPPPGTPLDRGHPLAYRMAEAYIANEGAGRIQDAVRGTYATRGGSGAAWGVGRSGPTMLFNGGSGENWTCQPRLSGVVTQMTIVTRCTPSVTPDNFDAPARYLNPPGSFGIYFLATGAIGWTGGGSYAFDGFAPGTMVPGVQRTVAITGRSGRSDGLTWVDGHIIGTNTEFTTMTFTGASDQRLSIGADPSGGRDFAGTIDFIYVYDRVLSVSELNAIYADPYQMFTPPVWRRYFVMPASGPTTAYKDVDTRIRISGQGYKDADTRLRLRADAYKDISIRFVVALGDQYARPMADVSNDNWTNELGGSTDLYTSIDETSASDADYIQSAPSPPDWEEYKCRISDLVYPAVFTGHTISLQYKKDVTGGDRIDLMISLYEADGTTLIAQQGYADIDALTTVDINLSEVNVDNIPYADYPDLVIGMAAIHNTGGGGIPPWL